jgi:hypothetical protein
MSSCRSSTNGVALLPFLSLSGSFVLYVLGWSCVWSSIPVADHQFQMRFAFVSLPFGLRGPRRVVWCSLLFVPRPVVPALAVSAGELGVLAPGVPCCGLVGWLGAGGANSDAAGVYLLASDTLGPV